MGFVIFGILGIFLGFIGQVYSIAISKK